MRNILITVCLLIALALQGCDTSSKETVSPSQEKFNTTGDSNFELDIKTKPTTPTIGLLNYFSALEEENIEEVKSCLSTETLTGISDNSLKQLASDTKKTKTNFRVHREMKKGNVAKVKYLYNKIDGEEIIEDILYLKLENGEWKVSLQTPNPNPFEKE